MIEKLGQDIHYGARMLRKNPGFTAVAVLTLALGIGANTAIFSVINAVLIRPLPYRNPHELVWLFAENRKLDYERLPPNWANETFSDLREQCRSFSATAILKPKEFILSSEAEAEQVRGMRASAELFSLLGVQPILGRTFLPEENEWGRHRVVVLSYEFWQQRFGGDRSLIGKTLRLIDTEVSDRTGKPHDTLDAQSYTVIGILPRGWRFPIGAGGFNRGAGALNFRRADIWEPESLNPDERQRRAALDLLICRLKPGITPRQADAEIQSLYQRFPDRDRGIDGVVLWPVEQQVVGSTKNALLLLFGAACTVLLIACVNVANLLLVRATERQKEFAIRAALGANRAQVFRQLLTENLFLSLMAGVVGVLLAYWVIRLLVQFSPADLPRSDEIRLDLDVLGFALVLSLLSTVVVGFMPALLSRSGNISKALNESGRGSSQSLRARRAGGLLVITEVAVAAVLLINTGLLLQSLARLHQVDPGYQPERVWKLQVSFRNPKFTPERKRQFVDELLTRIKALPGVQSAGAASWIPIEGGTSRFQAGFGIEGGPPISPDQPRISNMSWVTPGYFSAMGIPVLRGREFANQHLDSPAETIKIVNESFARKYFPNEDALGKRLHGMGGAGEIIGIVKDTREVSLDKEPEPHIFHAGITGQLGVAIVVRAKADASGLVPALRKEVLALDKDQPLSALVPLKEILATSLADRRFSLRLLGLFASLALVLAVCGLYAVIAYSTARRTSEIGVRMALGAQKGDVLGLIISNGVSLALIGLALGLIGAFISSRLLSSQIFGVTRADPLTYTAVSVGFLLAAFVASWLPARRATRVDPVHALRYE